MKNFLKVENLCFGYIKKPLCLKDVNFLAQKKDRVLILGLEDKGKTSLIKTISGFEEHFFGKVFLEEKEIRQISDEEKNVSVIFDEPILLNSTIDKNLNFVYETLKRETPERAEKIELLKIVNLDFDLNYKVKRLTIFEKFKLCLLRVFIKKSRMVLIDNIFKYKLKDHEVDELKVIIEKLMKESLLVISADDASFVKYRSFFDWFNPTKVLYVNNAIVYENLSIEGFLESPVDFDACSFSEEFEFVEGYCVLQEGSYFLSFNDEYVIKIDKRFNEGFDKLKLTERENEDIVLVSRKGLKFDLAKNNDVNNLFFEKKLMVFSKLDRSRVL